MGDFGGSDYSSLIGAGLSYMSSQNAADATKDAANTSNDTIWKIYNQNRTDTATSRAAGNAATQKLANYLGLDLGSTGTTASTGTSSTGTTASTGTTDNSSYLARLKALASQQEATNEATIAAKKAGSALQQIGEANSNGQDTILAHINPSEFQVLKAMGGSGRQDPVTGAYHFEENDDNAGYNDDGSWNDGRDRATEGSRASFGRVDPDAVQAGTAYGIDGSWGYNAKNGLKGALALGIPGLALGITHTKAVNGGGWGGLGSSGQGNGLSGSSDGSDGSNGGNGGSNWGSLWNLANSNGASNGTTSTGTTTGAGTTSTNSDYGSWLKDFSSSDLTDDDGYQFRLAEGTNAIDRSAASKGSLFSGATGKALEDYSQGLASTEYSNAYNRYMNNISSKYNMLSGLAGLGSSSTSNTNSLNSSLSSLLNSNYNTIGSANAYGSQALSDLFNNWYSY